MTHSLIPGSHLILKQGDNILLLRRKNTGYGDGDYWLVGGHVESWESFTQAMIREANEEVGIALSDDDLRLVHMVHRKWPKAERIDAFFLAESWSGNIVNREPDKCDDLSWFSVESLPKNTIQKFRLAIEAIGRGEFYSEQGWE